MTAQRVYRRRATERDLQTFASPWLWRLWPFLPLLRRPEGSDEIECGVLYDARGASGKYGHGCTVFLVNILMLPATEAALLAGPRCVYDTFDELADGGWGVD